MRLLMQNLSRGSQDTQVSSQRRPWKRWGYPELCSNIWARIRFKYLGVVAVKDPPNTPASLIPARGNIRIENSIVEFHSRILY